MDITILGIDPGLSGGLALVCSDGLLGYWPMPFKKLKGKKIIDEKLLIETILKASADADAENKSMIAYLEAVHAWPAYSKKVIKCNCGSELSIKHPARGVTSTFTFGEHYGYLRGLLNGLDIEVKLTSPQAWTVAMLKGKSTVQKQREVACRLFPLATFHATDKSRVPHAGMVAAALIAEYGYRMEIARWRNQ